MGKKKYSDEIVNLKRRIENIRRLISVRNRGIIRELSEIYGEQHPLVRYAWYLVQHQGQLRLTITERLNAALRRLEQRRVTRQTLEAVSRYLDDLERLIRMHDVITSTLIRLRSDSEQAVRSVVAHIIRSLQSRYYDDAEVEAELKQLWRIYSRYLKQFGSWKALDVNSFILGDIARHFPKTRLRIYVYFELLHVVDLGYRGSYASTDRVTIKTPYTVHADDLYANLDYYLDQAYEYAMRRLYEIAPEAEVMAFEFVARVAERR